MPSSIVKREKLVGLPQLALMALLFAVSFYFLLPNQGVFSIAESSRETPNTDGTIGDLDLAYLKARTAVGEQSVQETELAIASLIRSGQIDQARALLDTVPDATSAQIERFAIDLEFAYVDYTEAQSAKRRDAAQIQLLNLFDILLAKPALQAQTNLSRAAELSLQLDKPAASAALFMLLAKHDAAHASVWFEKCGDVWAAQQHWSEASACVEKALQAEKNASKTFDRSIKLLSYVSAAGNTQRQDSLVSDLKLRTPLSNTQRETLAQAMLASQRPDEAYKLYAALATTDKPNQVSWWLQAAKWAQASNHISAAAAYLDKAAQESHGADKVRYLQQAESLLVEAGNSEQVYERIAARIESNPSDAALLHEGILMARQVGKNDIAAKWNRLRLQANPTDIETLLTQIDLALANQDLDSALMWAKEAVVIAPDSVQARLRFAQTIEWTGDPVAAQEQWLQITQKNPSENNLTQVVRLAELNRDVDTATQALLQLLTFTPHNQVRISRAIELHELQGKPMQAAALLIDLQKRHGITAFNQRELALLYQRHVLYSEALDAWQVYAERYGRGTEETLNRMELSWRLNKQQQAAQIARFLDDKSVLSEASNDQIQLISKIAWLYKMPELAILIQPHIDGLKNQHDSLVLGRRLVQSLQDAGEDQQAISEATRLWQTTHTNDLAFIAMGLAYRTGDMSRAAPFLETNDSTSQLHKQASYWLLAAPIYHRNGQTDKAIAAYKQALSIEPDNIEALSGLLWSYIGEQDVDAIATFIELHRDRAESTPALWSAFALGYLQIGLPELSLTWFDRQLDVIEADYNMLLTFADALELSGKAEPARKVRIYALKRLRPLIVEGAAKDQDDLVRQYVQLVNRFGSAEDKERTARLMLDGAGDNTVPDKAFWREDVAISWLMATERHEHARIIMARLHDQRIMTPTWQALSIAMVTNDVKQIQQILDGSGPVSVGNHVLALRQLGHDQEAFIRAKRAINRAPNLNDQAIARNQYALMRNERPRFAAGNHRQVSMNALGIRESGFSIRHSLDSMNLGVGLDYKRRDYQSKSISSADNQFHKDIALTLFHGDRRFGGEITLGNNASQLSDFNYAVAKQHLRSANGAREFTAEIAHNEVSEASALLRLAAKQDRVTLGYEQALGLHEYIKLQADVNDISTRVEEKRVARGLAARMELGIRGVIGSNAWSTHVVANRIQNTYASRLPAELAVSPLTSFDSILSEQSTSLSVGASLSRGGTQANYPQFSSPRYYLNANVGHTWPDASFGAQFDAGAGIRILGGDELSFGFSHDRQPTGLFGAKNKSTSVGINYRYHF